MTTAEEPVLARGWSMVHAAEHYHVAPKILKAWLEVNAPWLLDRRGGVFSLDPAALERVLGPHQCAEDGCELLALGESDGCHRHRLAREIRGHPRDPEVVARVAASLRARTEEERTCAWCGESFVVPRHSRKRCCTRSHGAKLREREHPDRVKSSRLGRVVTCACGQTTRYLSPCQLGLVHCRQCYTSAPEVRRRKSEALRRFLAGPLGQQQFAAKLPLLHAGHQQWRGRAGERAEVLKHERGLLGTPELYGRHGFSEHMRRLLLEPELGTVEGLRLLLYSEQDVRLVKRSWKGGEDHRRRRWFEDEQFVLRWAAGMGLTRRLVARGLTEREVEGRIRQRFRQRREQLLRGRPQVTIAARSACSTRLRKCSRTPRWTFSRD